MTEIYNTRVKWTLAVSSKWPFLLPQQEIVLTRTRGTHGRAHAVSWKFHLPTIAVDQNHDLKCYLFICVFVLVMPRKKWEESQWILCDYINNNLNLWMLSSKSLNQNGAYSPCVKTVTLSVVVSLSITNLCSYEN